MTEIEQALAEIRNRQASNLETEIQWLKDGFAYYLETQDVLFRIDEAEGMPWHDSQKITDFMENGMPFTLKFLTKTEAMRLLQDMLDKKNGVNVNLYIDIKRATDRESIVKILKHIQERIVSGAFGGFDETEIGYYNFMLERIPAEVQ